MIKDTYKVCCERPGGKPPGGGRRCVSILYYVGMDLVLVWCVFCMFAHGYVVIVTLLYVLIETRNTHSCIY